MTPAHQTRLRQVESHAPSTESLTDDSLSQPRKSTSFFYDTFFASAAALDVDGGPSEAAIAESEVKRAFSQTSIRIVVAVDQNKLETEPIGGASGRSSWSAPHQDQ